MQQEILKKHPSAHVRVEVVWLPTLPGDSRALIDQRVLSDPRVSYYWDSNAVVGKWFATHVTHQPGISWDAFYLYGSQASWDSEPGPLVVSGSSIIGAKDDLLSGFNRLQATP